MTEKKAAELIAENLTAIYGYAYSKLYEKDKADELASEIVYEIIVSAQNLKNEDAFWGFAWKIAAYTFRRFIRRSDLSEKTVELSEADVGVYDNSPEQAYIEKQTHYEKIYSLRRELSLLKKAHREVCVAYYLDNKSCSEIAAEQKISVEMVKYYLFKTRKLLKEGIGMTRTLGEKSYNPGTFRLDFWGDRNRYDDLFKRKLPGSIVLAAYHAPMTAEELSVELGVAMPYLEEEIEILEAAGILRRTGDKYQTNLVILTDEYEKAYIQKTAAGFNNVAMEVFDKTVEMLPQIRTLRFRGNDFDDNRLLFGVINIIMVNAFKNARERSPIGKPEPLALGGNGWIFGYDNDYKHHHFHGVTLQTWNNAGTAWFSAENYKVIDRAQRYEHYDFRNKAEAVCDAILGRTADRENPALPYLIETAVVMNTENGLAPNFLVFDRAVYEELCELLTPIVELVTGSMISASDAGVKLLAGYVPASVREQCGSIAKIHHRFDVAAFLLEALIDTGKLFVPNEKMPLCFWGVRQ